MNIHIYNEAQTQKLARIVASLINAGDCIFLEGNLGAGKSVLARAMIRNLTREPKLNVPSPSFTLVQLYETAKGKVYHFDLWRLQDPEELEELGWEEARENIVIVEWPQILQEERPRGALTIRIFIDPSRPESRDFLLSGWDEIRLNHIADKMQREVGG